MVPYGYDVYGAAADAPVGATLPTVTDPDKAYAQLTRQEYMDYLANYRDFENKLIEKAQTDTSLIDQAREDTAKASALMRGVAERNAQRYGGQLTNVQQQQLGLGLQRANTLGGIQAVNDARIAQREANTLLLSDLINIGQGVNRNSQSQLGQSAANASQLKNAYQQAKAQSKANTYNTIASIASLALFAKGIQGHIMAVRSTVGQSIIENIGGALSFNPKRDENTLENQKISANSRELREQGKGDIYNSVRTAGTYITPTPDSEGSLIAVDSERLINERPDLAVNILNADPRYNGAIDEKGNRIATRVTDIIRNDDGSYSALVIRPDGRKAPLTENRTASGDDVVVKLSPQDLNKVLTRTLEGGYERGEQGAGSYTRGQADMIALADARNATLDAGADALSDNPGAASKFFMIVNQVDSVEDLTTIAADFGVDVPALIEEKRASLQIAERDKATAEANVRNVKLGQLASKDIRKGIADINKKIEANKEKLAGPAGKAAQTRIKELEKEREALIQQAINEDKSLAELRNEKESLRRLDYGGTASALAQEGRDRLQDLRTNLIPAREAEIRNALSTGTTETLLSTKVEVPTIDGSQVSLTADELRDAIKKGTVSATPEQVQKMRQYLVDQGVESPADLQRLPPKEQMMAALVASVGMGKTNEERAKAFQENINFLQRGARDRTLTQEISSAETTRDQKLRAQDLRQRRATYRNQLEEQNRDAMKQAGDAGKEAWQQNTAIIKNLVDEDGNIDPDNFAAAQADLNGLINTAAGFSPQDPRYANYQKAALNALVPYMIALAEQKGTGSMLNPLNWGRKFMDLWRDDAKFIAGDMSERIQVVTKTVNGKKIPSSIRILDNTGAPTDINVPIQDLNLSSGLLRVLTNIPTAQGR